MELYKPSRWYAILRPIVSLAIRALVHLDVQGTENVPRAGAVLIVSNHLHILDVPIIGIVIPRECVVLAADKWRKAAILGFVMKYAGHAIWIDREELDRHALAKSLQVLEQGWALGISPEGTRSKTGALQKAHAGVAYLASRSGAPIQLVAVSGQEKAIPLLKRLQRPTIQVTFGEPFQLPGTPNRARGAQLDAYTQEIMARLAQLLPPEYRGVYAVSEN